MRTLKESLSGCDPKSFKQESKIVNALYELISSCTSHLYFDDSWKGKNEIVNILGKYGEVDVKVEDGGYRSNKDGQQWKEWMVHLKLVNDFDKTFEFDFMITAHQAGSVNDPWDAYDMTMTRQYIK